MVQRKSVTDTQAKVTWKVDDSTNQSWNLLYFSEEDYPLKLSSSHRCCRCLSVTQLYCKGFLNYLKGKLNIIQ